MEEDAKKLKRFVDTESICFDTQIQIAMMDYHHEDVEVLAKAFPDLWDQIKAAAINALTDELTGD